MEVSLEINRRAENLKLAETAEENDRNVLHSAGILPGERLTLAALDERIVRMRQVTVSRYHPCCPIFMVCTGPDLQFSLMPMEDTYHT